MEKKYEDDELDKLIDRFIDSLIDEQYIKESRIMEEALFSDKDTEDYEASDEEIRASYQELVKRLKADGIYREDDGGDDDDGGNRKDGRDKTGSGTTGNVAAPNRTIMESAAVGIGDLESMAYSAGAGAVGVIDMSGAVGSVDFTDRIIPKAKKEKIFNSHKFAKAAGFVVVCSLCIFAASMTSEANRNYFVRNIKYLMGDDTKIVVGNDDKNEDADVKEYEAIKDIEEVLGIEVPEFLYSPEHFDFYQYEVDPYAQVARMEYIYNDKIIKFHIDREDETVSSKFSDLHGEKIDTIDVDSENISVTVRKIQDEQDETSSYLAQWQRDDVIYTISGKMELEELKKLIERIRYGT